MVDMSQTIIPKSDQLNADDLIAGDRVITITRVQGCDDPQQPVSVFYEGSSKPYKPCKSMRRVMVKIWGADASKYIGRSMRIYCDPSVTFGGMAVGGIRISHMSHMESDANLVLTASKTKRANYKVKPLILSQKQSVPNIDALLADLNAVTDLPRLKQVWGGIWGNWTNLGEQEQIKLTAAKDTKKAELSKPVIEDEFEV